MYFRPPPKFSPQSLMLLVRGNTRFAKEFQKKRRKKILILSQRGKSFLELFLMENKMRKFLESKNYLFSKQNNVPEPLTIYNASTPMVLNALSLFFHIISLGLA